MSGGQQPTGPARDHRAEYDHTGGSVERPGLVATLRQRVDGEVRFDAYTRTLYATDASAYEVTPVGVVYPESTADVSRVVAFCHERDIPVLPRGGGTSLAGQAVSEAVVLDFTREMATIRSVDPTAGTARVQPGVLLGDLNATLRDHGLKFAPDPAWAEKSTIGGAIGNNSSGSHSLRYGTTDAYVESCEVVLADGTVTELGPVTLSTLRERAGGTGLEADVYSALLSVLDEAATVREAYPAIERNVSGYNLDRLVAEATGSGDGRDGDGGRDRCAGGQCDLDGDRTVNLARLLAGSEGSLAVVTAATVALEPVPATKSMALLRYDSLAAAMADVDAVLDHDPAALEVLDDVVLELARETAEFGPLVEDLAPPGTGAVLLVEFYAESETDGRERVQRLLSDRVDDPVRMDNPDRTDNHFRMDNHFRTGPADLDHGETAGTADSTALRDVDRTDPPPVRTTGGETAHDAAKRDRFWTLRKSGLPILLSRTTDAKHVSFVEDVAVDPADLPDFVADFQAILEDNGTGASFYGHAGPGCLHVRPLVNTKSVSGMDQFESISMAVADLAVEYGGSVSGEHGDGRARTAHNRQLYGQSLWELFRAVKTAFDPGWLLNPGQVCGYAPDERLPPGTPQRARAVSPTENLRFDPDYEADLGFDPVLRWENDNGMQGMVELCHGCGGCRGPQDTTGGVMCPTYRAASEEITSTRGRANALRRAISGDLPADPTDEEFRTEVLDLCLGCKGCAKDCPSEVDVAKLSAELQHQHHERNGASLRDRLFANIDRVSALGSALAPLPRLLQQFPGSGFLAERVLGIARERDLPTFRRQSLLDRAGERTPAIDPESAERRVLLFPDTYTNYSRPDLGLAAMQVLEAAGVHVRVAGTGSNTGAVPPTAAVTASGRAAFSKGFLETARDRARQNVAALAPAIEAGWEVVVVEPSEAVMFQTDYRDLLGGDDVDRVASNTYGLCEYLDRYGLVDATGFDGSDPVVYHGHCHQHSTGRDHHAVAVLRGAGYAVEPLDSGCCGMAGSFGYEAEHYSMSMAIGRLLERQVADRPEQTVVAPGTSCRTQLGSLPGVGARAVVHPVEMLAGALSEEDRTTG